MGAPDPRDDKAAVYEEGHRHRTGQVALVLPARQDPAPPAVKKTRPGPINPIDPFILAKLEEKGLRPVQARRQARAAPAGHVRPHGAAADAGGDRRVSERRFAATPSPRSSTACSPRRITANAGAGTGSTSFATPTPRATTPTIPIPQMYRYRNWVIDAFNQRHALRPVRARAARRRPAAGRVGRGPHEQVIATGYLANSRRYGSYEDDRYPWHLTIEDTHRQPRQDVPGPDDRLRPLPRPQVRPDHRPRTTTPSTASSPARAIPGRASSWIACRRPGAAGVAGRGREATQGAPGEADDARCGDQEAGSGEEQRRGDQDRQAAKQGRRRRLRQEQPLALRDGLRGDRRHERAEETHRPGRRRPGPAQGRPGPPGQEVPRRSRWSSAARRCRRT